MRNKFIHFANVRKAIDAINALREQGEKLPRLGAWHAEAGRGKTETCIYYAGKHGARVVTPRPGCSTLDLLNDLYAELKGQNEAKFSRTQAAYDACLRLMFNNNKVPVIIDEAESISGRTVLVETMRFLSDRTNCPVIFSGTDLMMVQLLQREQVASRLAQVVKFEPLTVDEVIMAAAELCDISLPADSAEVLQKKSQGFIRDVAITLEKLERALKASKLSQPPAEMVEQVATQAIMRLAA